MYIGRKLHTVNMVQNSTTDLWEVINVLVGVLLVGVLLVSVVCVTGPRKLDNVVL